MTASNPTWTVCSKLVGYEILGFASFDGFEDELFDFVFDDFFFRSASSGSECKIFRSLANKVWEFGGMDCSRLPFGNGRSSTIGALSLRWCSWKPGEYTVRWVTRIWIWTFGWIICITYHAPCWWVAPAVLVVYPLRWTLPIIRFSLMCVCPIIFQFDKFCLRREKSVQCLNPWIWIMNIIDLSCPHVFPQIFRKKNVRTIAQTLSSNNQRKYAQMTTEHCPLPRTIKHLSSNKRQLIYDECMRQRLTTYRKCHFPFVYTMRSHWLSSLTTEPYVHIAHHRTKQIDNRKYYYELMVLRCVTVNCMLLTHRNILIWFCCCCLCVLRGYIHSHVTSDSMHFVCCKNAHIHLIGTWSTML